MEPAPIKIRILIVDDQLVVREGLRMLIENHPGTRVVAMARSRAEALELVGREKIDIVILDLELEGANADADQAFLQETERSGADAVLMNTGIANAQDPVLMAEAMKHAVLAGRQAYLAGRMPRKLYATASSPLEGVVR